MRRQFRLAVLMAGLSLAPLWGCGGHHVRRGRLPPAAESSTLGAGDRFELVIVGEEKIPKEYTVAPDGSVDLPYVKRLVVRGKQPQEVAVMVKSRLQSLRILRDPVVIVNVKEVNSKRVTVGGQISKPGEVPFIPGLTLMSVIARAGGFTPLADRDNVLVTRRGATGKTTTVSFSASQINDGRSPDVPLQSGDRVYVYERTF